jgi:hypothetical protein
MKVESRFRAFIKLGEILRNFKGDDPKDKNHEIIQKAVRKAGYENPWFIRKHIDFALNAIGEMLKEESLKKYLEMYPELSSVEIKPKTVGVVMAGNIPLVGFHDFLCVLISGNKFLGKLSSHDEILLPAIAAILENISDDFKDNIAFANKGLENFDAIIATGSNNTSRYFEYYFGKYPNIIRKNRNGVAVLTGDETSDELKALAQDILLYFGLGCRNISKIFIPGDYNIEMLLSQMLDFEYVIDNHKYHNNYDYFKSIYLINKEKYFDNGFLLLKEDDRIASPVSVVFFERYSGIENPKQIIKNNAENIQCVVSKNKGIAGNVIGFGQTQKPALWEYADDVDTLRFLISLN